MAPNSKGQPPKSAAAKTAAAVASAQPKKQQTMTNRPVVLPAIPLPLMQRQQQQQSNAATKKHAPTASVSSNGFPASSLEAALIDRDPAHSTNESDNDTGKTAEKLDHAFTPRPTQTLPVQTNGHQSHDSSVTDADSALSSVSAVGIAEGANGGSTYTSPPQSANSTSRHELASMFPAPPQHQNHVGDQHRHAAFHGPPHVHPHSHRQQLSNGGTIMFGGFDSHTPSPGPPPGAFVPPPPPGPHVNGDVRHPPHHHNGHHHAYSNSNGYPGPINTGFRGDMMPVSTMDSYGPVAAIIPPAHFDPLPQGMNRYGPPTPHSFHGSHNSGEPNGDSGPLPYPPPMNVFPHSRHEHQMSHPPPPLGPFPPFMPPQPFARPPYMGGEDMNDAISHISSQFDNRELADCVLELISSKGHHHPVKINGHKLILAQSPALKHYIKTTRDKESGLPTITVDVDDPYLRSDAWWMAVQHLYMHPLLQPPPIVGNTGNGMDFAGDKVDRFGFCLGYAAAGYHLGLRDVLLRGLHIAIRLLTWETIETAVGFIFEGTIQRQYDHGVDRDEGNMPPTLLEFNYGPETKILLDAVLDFLVNEFPSNFELDASVSDSTKDSTKFARFPANTAPVTPTTPASANNTSPAIARGTNVRRPPKTNRPHNIKFGDLPASYPEDGPNPHRQPAKCSSTLSRILLNLPYDQLCEVLSSGSSGVSGWNTAQDRYHAIADVVAEREARRLRAVEAIRNGPRPQALEVQSRLSTSRPYTVAEEWDGVNWQEKAVIDEGPVPRIMRRWVPQFGATPQPTSQVYNTPESMV
ncbi:hypothetical protein F5Y16DRAFT_353926 [Xylariaceae sp. FL0255]|nr:hypothetical protein F5Y16DRAFT_353926 [Xylariaceae sp. FL0255]